MFAELSRFDFVVDQIFVVFDDEHISNEAKYHHNDNVKTQLGYE
jgi:hypothetical protein